MLITFLAELIYVISGFMPVDWLHNYFTDTIQTQNTFDNKNAIRYNLRIFTRIFSS